MPRVMGNNLIHISQVTALCESCHELLELPETVLTETDKKIGQMIADEVPNGATLQLGIGGVPNAVGVLLRDKKDLGLHTEMFTDSMVDLLECGAVTNMKSPSMSAKRLPHWLGAQRKCTNTWMITLHLKCTPLIIQTTPMSSVSMTTSFP